MASQCEPMQGGVKGELSMTQESLFNNVEASMLPCVFLYIDKYRHKNIPCILSLKSLKRTYSPGEEHLPSIHNAPTPPPALQK